MEGVSWADLDADEQRAIAILGAGLSIELCEPLALLTLRRLGLVVGSHLTAAAHKLRRGFVLDELRRRDCSLKVSMRLGVRKMSGAIGLIVEGYVSLKDQKSLDELRIQRRKLIADLNACTGIDCTTTIQQIEEDIVVIETGLARLEGATTR